MSKKPNILFFFTDQHRGDTMGCAGNPAAITPNLDRLAEDGVMFSGCNTNSPLCMPARASIMTGKRVSEHGIWGNNVEADPKGPSHVRNIRDAGYRTSLVGKTHLWIFRSHDGHTKERVPILNDWGYDDTHELRDVITYANCECYYSDYLKEKGLLNVYREYMRSYVRGENRGYGHPWETGPSLLPSDENLDIYTARKSAEWIENYDEDKPFYLQVLFPGPHNPFDSPAEFRSLYNPEELPLAIMDTPSDPVSPQVLRSLNSGRLKDMTESQNRVMRAYYYAKVSHVDHGIGVVLKTLEDKGLMDNTWIVYTSDHGEMLGDHRLSHKSVFYEGALNIPLIIRPPKGEKGWKTKGLTDHMDIVESLLDIADAAPMEAGHGASLIPKIKAGPDTPDAQKGKEVVFSEVGRFSMVRNERYKMTVDVTTRNPVELYDMEQDPDELRNLVEDPAYDKVRTELFDDHLSGLLDNLNEEKFKEFQDTLAANPNLGGWKG